MHACVLCKIYYYFSLLIVSTQFELPALATIAEDLSPVAFPSLLGSDLAKGIYSFFLLK